MTCSIPTTEESRGNFMVVFCDNNTIANSIAIYSNNYDTEADAEYWQEWWTGEKSGNGADVSIIKNINGKYELFSYNYTGELRDDLNTCSSYKEYAEQDQSGTCTVIDYQYKDEDY